MNGETLLIVESAKLLGTVISSDLSWDENTADIVKKKPIQDCNYC